MEKLESVITAANEILLGKKREVRLAFSSLIAGGHLLIEDVPGVGKTTLVYIFGKLLGLEVSRIQFTNDLLPGDILGSTIYSKETEEFVFKKGPIFGQLILADELNRATPKTQSALLQVMEESKVSIEGKEFPLEYPFLIIATQNPFFQVGTFALPESQLDRFFMSLTLDFPEREFERKILAQGSIAAQLESLSPMLSGSELRQIKGDIDKVTTSDALVDYILDLLEKGRSEVEEGAYLSPRAGKDLIQASKAWAYLEGRDHVLPEDVQVVAPNVLGHRVAGGKGVKYGQKEITNLISKVTVDC